MDALSWIWMVLLLLSLVALIVGISRAKGHAVHPSVGGACLAGDHPYLTALRSGDPQKIANAPLPEFFSEELLLEGLKKIDAEQSLYDQFLDRIARQFTFRQYRKLTTSWKRYQESLGEGAATHNEFIHQLGKRGAASWEADKVRVTIEADVEEQKLRAEQARQARKNVRNPPPPAQQDQKKEKDVKDPIQREEEERERKREIIEESRAREHRHVEETVKDPDRKKREHERVDNIHDAELERLMQE